METRRLGTTGLKVSRLCLGCMGFGGAAVGNFGWTVDYEKSKDIIDKAIDLGINFFDTADVYSEGRSEEIVGRALEGRRNGVVIATKVRGQTGPGPNDQGLSRRHIRAAVAKSLERLRTDHIDLYQIHRPDEDTPIEETLGALNDLVRAEGVVNYIGACNLNTARLAKALFTSERLGLEKFVSLQNQYNLVYREDEREVLPFARSEGVALIPWSPLARGFLSGKYVRETEVNGGARYEKDRSLTQRYFKPKDFDVVERLVQIAKEKGVTPSQLAVAWLLKRGVDAPIVGVTKVEQIVELTEGAAISVSDDEARRLEEPYQPAPLGGDGQGAAGRRPT